MIAAPNIQLSQLGFIPDSGFRGSIDPADPDAFISADHQKTPRKQDFSE
jgi:hypothetical protein